MNINMTCYPEWLFIVRDWMNEGFISGIDYLNAKMYLIETEVIIDCVGRMWN